MSDGWLRFIYVVLVMLIPGLLFAQSVDNEEAPRDVTEVIISGRLQGPPLWEVSKGDHKLLLFGLPDVVPEQLEWNPAKIEKVLAEAEVILGAPGAGVRPENSIGPFKAIGLIRQYRKMRKLDDKKSLDELVSPELFLRITALQKKYGPRGQSLHKLRPFLVAAKLTESAMDDSDLEGAGKITRTINKLVKKAGLDEVDSTFVVQVDPKSLLNEVDATPWEDEVQCLATVVETLETDIRNQRERAISWSYGEMAEIYAQDYPDPSQSCLQALLESSSVNAFIEAAKQHWLGNAETVIREHKTGFGMLAMRELVTPGGLLAELEARGYDVRRP